MPDFLAELLAQIRSIWSRLDAGQRTVIGAVVLGVLAGLGAIVWFAGRPDYQILLTTEDPAEFAQATGALDGKTIAYKLDGRSILVDSRVHREAHAALFGSGVLGGEASTLDSGLGGVTLDSQSKQFLLQQKHRKLAEASLRQLAGVQRASITFSRPKRTPFRQDDTETQPRASVVLGLRSGESFRRIARSAVDVVAAALAVPPEFVTVTNAATAETYRVDAERGDALDSGEFYAQQARRSAELTEQAQRMLARVYPDQALVAVTVELDPNWEIKRSKILPDAPLLKSDRSVKTESGGPGQAPGGDPSTTAALTNTQGAGSRQGTNETRDREFEVDIGTSQSGKLAPDVRKLSVALVLDEALQLDQAKIDKVSAVVKSAVGWSIERDGDAFAVHIEKFKPLPEVVETAGPGFADLVQRFGPTAGQVLAVLLVLLFLRGLLRRGKAGAAAGGRVTGGAQSAAAPQPETPEDVARHMRREIEAAIASDPAAISRLLETWLAEQKA
jgi:flagellar M-ring protein FliF